MAASEMNGNGVQPHTNGTVPITNGSATYAEKHNIADHFIGGNKLKNAPAGAVKDFVAGHDGHTVITNVRTIIVFMWEIGGSSGN
jgi:acetyl-CoA carboxylase/biotin carboxylase 1